MGKFFERSSRWEPEPLQLPVEDVSPWRKDRPRRDDDHDRDTEDLPGSHVIVIDLA